MRLSNKSTFPLICLIALFVLAAMPAMAQTISATWTDDLNDDNTRNDPGWNVTIGGLSDNDTNASDTVTVTSLDVNGTIAANATGVTGLTGQAVDEDETEVEGTIVATIGTQIAVQVVATLGNPVVTTTHQRVTFPVAGPGAELTEQTLVAIPMLMELTVDQYYLRFGKEVTVTFNFATPEADSTFGAPSADLHVSDIDIDGGGANAAGLQVVRLIGSNQVVLRSNLADNANSASSTVDLEEVFALATTPTATDGQATVTYDDTAPTITVRTDADDIAVAAPPGSPTPSDGVWGGAFPVFNLTFSVSDDSSGLPDENPVRIETDTDKLEVVAIGLGIQTTPDTDTEYLVQIRPRADRATTAGEDVVIHVIPVDNAGNEGRGSVSVKLAANTPDPVAAPTASPASGSRVEAGGTITLTFAADPGTVTTNVGTITPSGTTRTLTIPSGQEAGAVSIMLGWDYGGSATLAYTVTVPPAAAVAFSNANPASGGSVVAGNTITLTFAADPGTVTTSLGTVTTSGATRTLTIPAGQAAGEVTITLGWTMTGRVAGSQMLTYTITRPFVSENPTSPSNISAPIEIPANSYVVLVRDINSDAVGLSFPMVDGNPVMKKPWPGMPDLEALFNRSSFGQGGALVLRKSADARDNDMQDADGNNIGRLATPGVGSVGISEIMWALDLGLTNRDSQPGVQWIELHNLNDKPVRVLIYAQTAREIVSGGLVGSTEATDSIIGNLGGMVIDAITNIRNKGDQTQLGWDVPGDNGNSVTGDDFTSMYRILPHNQPAYTAAQNYTKRNGRDKDVWRASPAAYAVARTDQPASATTDVVAITNYKGTPGQRNDYTGVSLHTPAGRTGVPSNTVVINEVANLSNPAYEWIELRNLTGGDINLRNYLISIVKAVDREDVLYQFPANNNAVIPANGVFLLVATDPRDDHAAPSVHPLAVGYNVDRNPQDQVRGLGDNPPRYKVTGNLNIPDNGEFVLILRRPDDGGGQRSNDHPNHGVAERGDHADLDKILDIAGYHPNLSKGNYPNPVSSTKMWPLRGFGRGPQFNRNQFHVNTVHYRAHTGGIADGLAGAGAQGNHNDHRAAFQDAGYTGIGYKRQAARTNVNGGSPGYHGIENGRTASGAKLVISEIMLIQGNGRTNLPQWIEIHNPNDNAVNLSADAGWRIVIEEERIALRTINFKARGNVKWVQPNQTILVVSGAARDLGSDYLPASVVFPSTRVYNVYREQAGDFGMTSRFDPFLNKDKFNLKLIDGQGNVSDEIGNLDGNVRTSDTAKWEFSKDTLTKDGLRTSLIRVTDNGVARNALNLEESNVLPVSAKKVDDMVNLARGQIPEKYAWVRASQANLGIIKIRHTWYGSEEDFGTPLYREGAVLPVELSSFLPALEDGKVVIRWTTESELDNAGFNILRSDSRNGEFVQVNEELIDGKGTTAERSSYKWIDPSAKPGVVYYYQIEDVSFAGERTLLTTTKLKGLISAKNKLTTTWSELKEIQ